MVWFRVDDGFYDHPKIEQLPHSAIGLWAKAGSWCAKHLTDGVVPATAVRRMRGTRSQVQALIECDLWVESCTESGAKAYAFRDWNDYQSSRDEVLEKRAEWAEKKRKLRAEKSNSQLKRENVPGGVSQGVRGGVHGGRAENVPGGVPVPFHSIPFQEGGGVVGTGTGSARAGVAATPSKDSFGAHGGVAYGTPDDPRCAEHATWPRDQVPACGACGQARRWFQQQAESQKQAARRVVDECGWCDERGFVEFPPSAAGEKALLIKCDHLVKPQRPHPSGGEFHPTTTPEQRAAARQRASQNRPKTPPTGAVTDENTPPGTSTPNDTANSSKPPF